MKLLHVPPLRGLTWVRSGLGLFFRQPAALSVLLLATLVLAMLAGSLPLVGGALVMALAPWMNLAFLLAGEDALAGRPVSVRVLAAPLRAPAARRGRLVQLCLLHGLAAVALLAAADVFDSNYAPQVNAFFEAYAKPGAAIDAQVVADVQRGALLRLGLLIPLLALAWYAPIILLRSDDSLPKAVFASALTTWRNAGAFVLYGLGWMGVNALIGLVSFAVALLSGAPALFVAVLFPLSTMFAAAVLVSQIFTVRDCLDMGDGAPGTPADPPPPPVA